MIEAELKARVRDVKAIRAQLSALATGEQCVYNDTYYQPNPEFTTAGYELRLRVISSAKGDRALLTFKQPPVDASSGSKPEHETTVADPAVVGLILSSLGSRPYISFEKRCTNYKFIADGREMLATLVTVPELDGTYLELETLAQPQEAHEALASVRQVLGGFGLADSDLTLETYTDAVLHARTADS